MHLRPGRPGDSARGGALGVALSIESRMLLAIVFSFVYSLHAHRPTLLPAHSHIFPSLCNSIAGYHGFEFVTTARIVFGPGGFVITVPSPMAAGDPKEAGKLIGLRSHVALGRRRRRNSISERPMRNRLRSARGDHRGSVVLAGAGSVSRRRERVLAKRCSSYLEADRSVNPVAPEWGT
jgi:hypothetical protein